MSFHPQYNAVDGNINRISFSGIYEVHDKIPINPFGRTGIIGRGLLGRWGPNHAADPIVTKWKRDSNGTILTDVNSKRFAVHIENMVPNIKLFDFIFFAGISYK